MRQVGQLPRIIAWCTVNKTLNSDKIFCFELWFVDKIWQLCSIEHKSERERHMIWKKKMKSYVMFFSFKFKPKLDHTISWNTSQLASVRGSEIFIGFFAWNRVSLTYAWKSIMNYIFFFNFVTANHLHDFLYSWAERGTGLTLIFNSFFTVITSSEIGSLCLVLKVKAMFGFLLVLFLDMLYCFFN